MTVAWTESTIEIAGTKLHVRRGGKGPVALVLHRDSGTPDRTAFHDGLAATHDVIVPDHPGWGKSQRAEWMRSVRDIAVMYRTLLAKLGVEKASLVGLGFGGWIAAEMASMAPRDLRSLALVGAMGIKPPEGYILDQALVSYIEYARAGFHSDASFAAAYGAEPTTDQLEQWDICREMSFRVAWKPYMYSQTLPHLLDGVTAPSLVIWGESDKVVPASAGRAYAAALKGARFEIVKEAGHCIDLEQPATLQKLLATLA